MEKYRISIDPDALTLGDIETLEEASGLGLVEVLATLASGDVRRWSAKLLIGVLVINGLSPDEARTVRPMDLDFSGVLPDHLSRGSRRD